MAAVLSDADFARRYGTPPPSPAILSDDEFSATYGGDVAAAARQRLASRGLTPEGIKADPLSPMPPQFSSVYSGIGEMIGVDDGTGIRTDLKTTDGGLLERLGQNLNPVEIAKNLGKGLLHDFTTVEFGYTPSDPHVNPMPNLVGIAKESYRRGEEGESAAGMYADPVAAAILAGAGAGVSRVMKGAPKTVKSAETAYTDALALEGAPLTETLAQKMMDRKVIVGDPAKLATRAQKAADAANATKDALVRDNPLPERWRSTPARRETAQKVRSAAEEAQFQTDLQAIAERLPASQGVGNVLTGIGGAAVKTALGMRGGVMNAVSALTDLPKFRAFETAKAIAKREFGKAMSAGDETLAAEIGAGIAAGAYADDDFGHRSAIQSLSKEAEAAGSPELRRQVVASKRGYYTDSDGRTIQIPANVMSAMVDAKNVNETESPVALWLGAMKKQGNIRGGGSLSFGENVPAVVSRAQSGAAPAEGRPHWERAGAFNSKPLPRDKGAEFPSGQMDENYSMLREALPSQLLPPEFTNARRVLWGAPTGGTLDPENKTFRTYGANAINIDPRDPQRLGILIDKDANQAKSIWAHEVGHAIYDRDFTPEKKAAWAALHQQGLAELRDIVASAGIPRDAPNLTAAITRAASGRVPAAVIAYASDPGHSFAELEGQFMANPSELRQKYPRYYQLIEKLLGVNYVGGKMNPAK